MKPEIIVMLTHHDVTVSNARELFLECAELPVTFWGLKDVGLDKPKMVELVDEFRNAGKTPVIEVVSFEESKALEAARLARDCGIEYFTGTRYSTAVLEFAKEAGLKYFPFAGDVSGEQIALRGDAHQVAADAQRILDDGADGIDLVAYRAVSADPVPLAKDVLDTVGGERVIIAGSINSMERIRVMEDLGPLGFTIGGALFEDQFVDGGFRSNLECVVASQATLRGAAS